MTGAAPGAPSIVWSDTQTTFLGHIDARGAQAGGAVELSSKERLRRASLANVQVGDGELLLDPKNIVIGEAPTVQGWAYVGILGAGYTPPAGGANSVGVTTLDSEDFFGHSVALNAAGDRLAVGVRNDDGAGNNRRRSGACISVPFHRHEFFGRGVKRNDGERLHRWEQR